jgi:hypothetical protein
METPGIAPGLLGDFPILREVGRGGMGVVCEARQISLNRGVALKILTLAATMGPRQLQRFQLEAQVAACLHHTNIVPIHAVGCERGMHSYAMQFIEGQNLAAINGELRVLEGLEQADETKTNESSATLAGWLAGGEPAPPESEPPGAGSPLEPGLLSVAEDPTRPGGRCARRARGSSSESNVPNLNDLSVFAVSHRTCSIASCMRLSSHRSPESPIPIC